MTTARPPKLPPVAWQFNIGQDGCYIGAYLYTHEDPHAPVSVPEVMQRYGGSCPVCGEEFLVYGAFTTFNDYPELEWYACKDMADLRRKGTVEWIEVRSLEARIAEETQRIEEAEAARWETRELLEESVQEALSHLRSVLCTKECTHKRWLLPSLVFQRIIEIVEATFVPRTQPHEPPFMGRGEAWAQHNTDLFKQQGVIDWAAQEIQGLLESVKKGDVYAFMRTIETQLEELGEQACPRCREPLLTSTPSSSNLLQNGSIKTSCACWRGSHPVYERKLIAGAIFRARGEARLLSERVVFDTSEGTVFRRAVCAVPGMHLELWSLASSRPVIRLLPN